MSKNKVPSPSERKTTKIPAKTSGKTSASSPINNSNKTNSTIKPNADQKSGISLSFESFQKSLKSIEKQRQENPRADIAEILRAQGIRSPFVVVADESLRLERLVQHVHEKLFPSTTLGSFQGNQLNQASDLAAFQAKFLTLSLFSSAELIVVWNAEKLKASTEKTLETTLGRNLSNQLLILAVEFEGKGGMPLSEMRALGTTLQLSSLSPEDLHRWVHREVERFAVAIGIDPQVVEILCRTFQGKLHELSSEIQRLSLVAGSGQRIESRHLAGGNLPTEERDPNELMRCILGRDLRGAHVILRSLSDHGFHPLQISAQMSKAYRVLLANTHSERPLHKDVNAPWILRQLGVRRNFKSRELERALDILKNLDLELKDSGLESEDALTYAVEKLCMLP